jgi:folate-binding protein YgfZ
LADVDADYAALRTAAGAVRLRRDHIRVAGPDAASFLQGQLSQDVDAVADGGSAWSFLLQPQGKVDALVRVRRHGGEEFFLDVDGGFGDAVMARLNRFKLRVKVDVDGAALHTLAIRGPQATAPSLDGRAIRAVDASWPGLPGFDLVADEEPPPPEGVPVCALDAYETVRIEAGIPVMGREVTEATIPPELGIVERTVSFTKGCFTGQELVARIEARGGHVPRRLRGVVGDGTTLAPGDALFVGDKKVGVVTSAAYSPARKATVALAFVARSVEPPAEVVVGSQTAPVRVEALPLVP